MKKSAPCASFVRHRLLRCAVAVAAAVGAGACGPGEATDPAAVWDPCALPAGLLTEAGFPAESRRRDVATEPGWAGCGWTSADAAVRVLFATAATPDDVGGEQAPRTEVTVADRAGQRLHTGAADTAATCTYLLPTEDGGLVRVRVDSVPTGGGACGRAERVTGILAPALPA
ncbi:hypothetical protein [Nocardia sp. CA-290969]|uniref:hypothetical protein n=1 Tax=Nocardia sp. CA-290969 TaxID=3239986 RepID=UPI003D92A358